MDAYAQRPDYSDETEQMLMRYGSGRLNLGGCNLSDLEVKNLIGEQVYYETYLGARQRVNWNRKTEIYSAVETAISNAIGVQLVQET